MKRIGTHIYQVIKKITALFVMLLLFSGCTGLKKLEDGQQLYTGSDIKIEATEPFDDKRNINRELERVLRPQPNSTFLGMRPRLWMYQHAGEPTGRGVRHWMKNRLGEEAVLFQDVDIHQNIRLIDNRLYNLGYFDPSIKHSIDSSARKAGIEYNILLRPPYRFGTLYPIQTENQLSETINDLLHESLLVKGEPYSLELLKRERQRIDRALKKQGYFYFHPDHILFRADSSANNRTVDVHLTIKHNKPAAAGRQYRIGNIFIHADYMTRPVDRQLINDTIVVDDGLYFMDAHSQFNPHTIVRAIFLRKDSIYNSEDHDRTLNHLMSLGTFRFVNLRFLPREADGKHLLDVRVHLTPIDRKSLSVELKGVTKSNNFAGPGLSTSFTNHNLFKGAESFRISTNAAYETLVGRQAYANSREFGLDGTLSFPRFVLPFGWKTHPNVLSPKTNISLGTNFMGRTDAFNLTTMTAQYTYLWSQRLTSQFRVSPLSFNLYRLGNVDESMENVLIRGTLLRRGLFEQFVIGGQFTYVYNSRLKPGTRNDWFFQFNLDMSGNLAYLIMKGIPGVSEMDEGGYGIFKQSFAQYSKADVDLRHYFRLGNDRLLVGRIFAGAGLPYGNSDMMPYVKQFVIGGSNSIRAFQPRSLGPGAYSPDEEEATTYSIYRTGELKMEANLEYRFTITGMFKGAFFLDAGNIWRFREDDEVPGGKFETTNFLEQIALGTGTGLRIDAGFFLLRFDFAFPLANPGTGNDSYFDPIRLHDRNWRRNNLVFNLAIGYPF